MIDLNGEDAERLANRLAMVVSEDGEAENAGRAMGQLARRLGLTGGQLKEIFVVGAATAGSSGPIARQQANEIDRLQSEVASLRHSLRVVETTCLNTERERDALQEEIGALRQALGRTRRSSWVPLMVAAAVLLAVGVAGAASYFMPAAAPPPPAAQTAAATPAETHEDTVMRRVGVVRSARTAVFRAPDRAAPVLATLPAGMPVVVHRLVWNMLMQWAEIEIGSGIGYVQTSDIDLS